MKGYHVKPHDAKTLYALREIERDAGMDGVTIRASVLNHWLDWHEEEDLEYTLTSQEMGVEEFYGVREDVLAMMGIAP
jgi:hypothetical protein